MIAPQKNRLHAQQAKNYFMQYWPIYSEGKQISTTKKTPKAPSIPKEKKEILQDQHIKKRYLSFAPHTATSRFLPRPLSLLV
jgi:hypothetical protein